MTIYIIAFFIVLFLSTFYSKTLRVESLSRWTSPLTFSLKFGAGLFFLFIYTRYYGDGALSADAGDFMRESKILNNVFNHSPQDYFRLLFDFGDNSDLIGKYLSETKHWDAGAQSLLNDNRFLLKLHSIIHFISFQSPVIHVMIMCFISTIASWQLFLAIRKYSIVNDKFLYWLLICIPSVLFWTSGIIKEPLMFLGFAIFMRGLLGELTLRKRIVFLFVGLALLVAFKPYVIISAIPALIFFVSYKYLPRFKLIGSLFILIFISSLSVVLFPGTREKVVHLISRKQFDFNNVAFGGLHAYTDSCFYFFEADEYKYLNISEDSVSIEAPTHALKYKLGEIEDPIDVHLEATSDKALIYYMNNQCRGYIETTMINDSFIQLVKNIPEALINTWLRPAPWDRGGWLKYPAMLELWLMFALLLYALKNKRALSPQLKSITWSLLIFALTLSIIIGLVTPVFGAINRYRIPSIFVMVLISMIIINPPLKFKKK